LSVLDLGDDLNVFSVFAENLSDGFDVLSPSDKGSEDHIDIILDTKSEIRLILLRESWEIDIGVGKVDTLLGRDLAIVSCSDADSLRVNNLEDVEGKDTVINIDDTSWLDNLGDVLVVNIPRNVELDLLARKVFGTYIFLSSQQVAYFSSVVKFISVPAEIGISASPVVLPVRISGPLVSNAIAN
jgi:hypothetical protein